MASDLERRLKALEALEAQAAQESRAQFDALLRSLSDDELDRYIASIGGVSEELEALTEDELERLVAEDTADYREPYRALRAWLEEDRASIA